MIEKFIEGTDDQYSIREDGVVIKHYKILRNQKRVYERSILQGSKDPRGTTFQFVLNGKRYGNNKLLIDYYGFKPCKNSECSNPVTQLFYLYCNDCKNLQHQKVIKRCRTKNPEKTIINRKKHYEKSKSTMPKHSIAGLLRISVNDLSDELYEHHRNLILLKRKIAKEHNLNISSLK
jgi:hypothetical protein